MVNLFKKSQSEQKKQYYLGFILKAKEGYALVLELNKVHKIVHTIDEKKIIFSDQWGLITENVDEALFQLERDNNCSLKEVIFFLYADIVDQKNKKIKKEYLQYIKQITKELELQPLGYIDYQEAISIYFSEQEQRLLTALIIEIDTQILSLFVYKNGILVFSEQFERHTTLTVDFENLFATIKGKTVLPSRILVYDSSTLEQELGDIITHRWSEDLFVQMPKFEIMTKAQLMKALLFVFAEQLCDGKDNIMIEELSQEVLGFTIGEDIQKKPPTQQITYKEKREYSKPIFGFISRLFGGMPHIFTMIGSRLHFILMFIAVIIIIGVAGTSMLYFFHKAEVILVIQSKKIEKQIDISGFLGKAEKDTLKIDKTAHTIEKKDTITTTGKKTIGERAQGEVTIYNSLKSEKIFKKDTIFKTDAKVIFLLQDEVKIASASDTLTTEGNVLTVTGKSKASLIAENIGTEGNISKDEKFIIEDFPTTSFFALPMNAFSGGTKRDVQTVSKDDLRQLKDAVLDQMKKEGEKIAKAASANQTNPDLSTVKSQSNSKIIDALTTVEIVDEKYSKELGEEAKNVSIEAKASVVLYSYDENNVKQVIASLFSDFIPSGYHLPVDNIIYAISDAKIEDKKITISLAVDARTIAELQENKVVKDIERQSIEKSKKILKEKYKIDKHTIDVQTPIPFLKSRLPFFTKNIILKVESL